MIRYAATIFVSAFLLFQVQPMVARFILPWFGGSSLVWTTCMLFFQTVLVLGYAYAHFVTRRLTPTQQWILHTILLGIAVLCLPVRPTDYWKPLDSAMPTWRILTLLTVSVGLPFFLVSTTGPLIQAWQSKTHPGRSPFRLFALSNFASLLALISYPFVFERWFVVNTQSWIWSITFGVFAVLAFLCGRQFSNSAKATQQASPQDEAIVKSEKISKMRFALWLLLPMLASVQLLATTNLMTQEIGSLPFLWIVPLSLYLISFIICFDHSRWYFRPVFFLLFFGGTVYSSLVLEAGVDVPIQMQIIGYSLICFGASMCCHGELALSKPGPEHLTMFYLMVSIGGALGGVFVALVAPHIFVGYYEFQVGLLLAILCCLIAYGIHVRAGRIPKFEDSETASSQQVGNLTIYAVTLFLGLLTCFFVVGAFAKTIIEDNKKYILLKTRNEYGTLTIEDHSNYRKLNNGQIEHGFQYKDENLTARTSYYGPESGLGWAIRYLRNECEANFEDQPLDLGAIGLGVGTICAWCEPQDTLRFFEINPQVLDIAKKHFWYLDECLVEPEVVLGDARLQLEREVERQDTRKYDVLIADAFSSDSIPMHLLTLESMRIYKARLKENGILAVHTSNRFLSLENVVRVLAEELGMTAVIIDDDPDDRDLYNSSTWVVVTNNVDFIDFLFDERLEYPWPDEKYAARWTDDFASIIQVIKTSEEDWLFGDNEWFGELLQEKGWWSDEDEESEDE